MYFYNRFHFIYFESFLFFNFLIIIFIFLHFIFVAFDANVVEVRKEDVQEFLGALDDSLRKATPRHNTTAV